MGKGRTSAILFRSSDFIQRQQETVDGFNADLNFDGILG